jgi:hypothetical protein
LKAQASTATKPHQLTQSTVGWGNAAQNEPSFGGGSAQDGASVKAKTINLINSVRTLMRSEYLLIPDRQPLRKEINTDMFLNNSPTHLPQHHDHRVGRRVRLSTVNPRLFRSRADYDHITTTTIGHDDMMTNKPSLRDVAA